MMPGRFLGVDCPDHSLYSAVDLPDEKNSVGVEQISDLQVAAWSKFRHPEFMLHLQLKLSDFFHKSIKYVCNKDKKLSREKL